MHSEALKPPGKKFGMDIGYLKAEWRAMISRETLMPDIGAGITVALVALPLNLALAIAAGVEPGVGITTGIVASLIGALFGGQRFAITGPAAAMAVILVEIAQSHGIEGIWLVGMIAGLMQIVAGALRFGKMISFVPMPVIVGFANAIGCLVFFNALDDFLGLPQRSIAHAAAAPVHAEKIIPEFIVDMTELVSRCFATNETNIQAIAIGAAALFLAIIVPKFTKLVPGQLVAIVVATIFASALKLDVPRIIDISSIPRLVPFPAFPNLPWSDIGVLFPTAVTVFLLGSIESLLSASVADGMSNSRKHNSSQELIGQGMANFIVPFFGGIPVTGVIARTAVNIKAGAKTRFATIVHSLFLLTLMFTMAKYAEQIPLSALAAILLLTGVRLVEWDAMREIWKGSRVEGYVVIATTMASVLIDLTAGVFIGLLLSSWLFIRHMSSAAITSDNVEDLEHSALKILPTCKFVKTYVIDGPLFFGAVERFVENIVIVDTVKVVILHMRAARFMDLTGVETLLSIQRQLQRHGGRLVLCELPAQPRQLLESSEAFDVIGRENVFSAYRSAVISVNSTMLAGACARCGPSDCQLRRALLDTNNPMRKMIDTHERTHSHDHMSKSRSEGLEWLIAVDSNDDIPQILRDTPVATLIRSQNMGDFEESVNERAELVIGMCIDYRKALSVPKDFAYILRREGANMNGAEYAIALALSKGIKYMALIAHNDCAMSNTGDLRETFIDNLADNYKWSKSKATTFFDDHIRSKDIGNEVDFVLEEALRLSKVFPGLKVIPMLFRVEDNRLYLILDWLWANAADDPITQSHSRRTGERGNTYEIDAPVV